MSAYGYCPHCGAPGKSRERRINGNDTCENGHVYPSASSLKQPPAPPSGLTFEHYQKFVHQGVILDPDTRRERNLLGGMGLAGEAGEVCDHLKKFGFHGVDIDRDKLIKELGDVLWYFALVLHTENITLETVMKANIFKLCDRYSQRHGDPEDVIAGRAV